MTPLFLLMNILADLSSGGLLVHNVRIDVSVMAILYPLDAIGISPIVER